MAKTLALPIFSSGSSCTCTLPSPSARACVRSPTLLMSGNGTVTVLIEKPPCSALRYSPWERPGGSCRRSFVDAFDAVLEFLAGAAQGIEHGGIRLPELAVGGFEQAACDAGRCGRIQGGEAL